MQSTIAPIRVTLFACITLASCVPEEQQPPDLEIDASYVETDASHVGTDASHVETDASVASDSGSPDAPPEMDADAPQSPPDAEADASLESDAGSLDASLEPDGSLGPDASGMAPCPPTFAGVTSASPVSDTEITVSWTAALDCVYSSSGIVYEVCATTTSGNCAANFVVARTTASGVTSTTVTGLTAGTAYYVVVRARDAAGNEDSNVVQVSVQTCAASGRACSGGACSALASDPANCGACSHACSPGVACSAGQCLPTKAVPVAVAVAAGTYHTCSLLTSGTVACWGGGDSNALGRSQLSNSPSPIGVRVSGLATAIAAGAEHACALVAGGTVECWGRFGFEANSSFVWNTPISVPELRGVTAIASGANHACALLGDGTVACWGVVPFGTTSSVSTTSALPPFTGAPIHIAGLSGVTAITAGETHTCALLADGTVKCWGGVSLGGDAWFDSATPVAIPVLSGATAIVDTCALFAGGTVECWGARAPLADPGLSGATTLAVGRGHACALLADRTVTCWGSNDFGELGDGTTTRASSPVTVLGLSGATAIAAGGGHACAVVTGGTIKCWGWNELGQLGNGTNVNSPIPLSVLELGLLCDPAGEVCRRPECGDGLEEQYTDRYGIPHEGCDDGNLQSGDGCDANCELERGWVCWQGEACRSPRCGDGYVDYEYLDSNGVTRGERCDDRNAQAGDGCAADCAVEPGWTCETVGQPCRLHRCGDGLIESYQDRNGVFQSETCEDGNASPGDGCAADCKVELGWACSAPGQPCRLRRCGDGLVESYTDRNGIAQTETCDDGNASPGDGCAADCKVELGWACGAPGQPCRLRRCGDGLVESYTDRNGIAQTETCDNGNTAAGDGCSADCKVESGWVCKVISCSPTCTYDANQCSRSSNTCAARLNGQPSYSVPWQGQIGTRMGSSPDCPYVKRSTSGTASVTFAGDDVSGWAVIVSTLAGTISATAMAPFSASGSHVTASTTISSCINHAFFGWSGSGTVEVDFDCATGVLTVQSSCTAPGGGTVCAARFDADEDWQFSGSVTVP